MGGTKPLVLRTNFNCISDQASAISAEYWSGGGIGDTLSGDSTRHACSQIRKKSIKGTDERPLMRGFLK
jgi:hypothetical protein